MRATNSFDILHVQVAPVCNPHDLAAEMQDAFPRASNLEIVSGVNDQGEVEYMLNEHPTTEQANWLEDHPCVAGFYIINEEE